MSTRTIEEYFQCRRRQTDKKQIDRLKEEWKQKEEQRQKWEIL